MDKYGLLTIKFSSQILIPSYLLRELDQNLNPPRSSSRRLNDFAADVFLTAADYWQNINDNWSSKRPETLKVPDYQPYTEESSTEDIIGEENEENEEG